MNKLYTINRAMNPDEMKEILGHSTIFDKIEFSGITKERIQEKITYLETIQVPNRKVLLHMDDRAVVQYWFKNWLHPELKHAIPLSPTDKRGCSRKVRERDMQQDSLHFYENGQQNFTYSLNEIKEWLRRPDGTTNSRS